MREERIETDGVPGRLYAPDGATGLLLLGHGGGGSKDDERFVELGRTYADGTGLAVVCIDGPAHGERAPDTGDTHEDERAIRRAMFQGGPQMVKDWQSTAESLSAIGPAVAYVGFSMGMMFGAPTVAAMRSIKAAVFGVGGIPGEARDREAWLAIARKLEHPQVLMLNMTQDPIFKPPDSLAWFAAIPGHKKRIMFWEGGHVGLPAESIRQSIEFLQKYATT
jgi:pimeloyl-ACP methyl ester carboxylesterase